MLVRSRSGGRSQQNSDLEERILSHIEEDPTMSTRQIATMEGVSHTTVWRTLKDQQMHPYHYQRVQQLEEGDPERRRNFCSWMLQKLRENENFISQILFTDEAGFDRSGVFNLHNEHVWAIENPHAVVERHSQRQFSCNVWAGIVNETLIGPVILPNRLTGQYYLDFLQNELPELLADVPLSTRRDMWYMHDGAPPHSTTAVTNHLNSTFGEKWIGRRGPVPWPARSPDLNPLDFFFWGHFKTLVYSTPVNTLEDLVLRIQFTAGIIKNVTGDFKKVNDNFRKRIQLCLEQDGGHFEHLL
ncbi:histone-lysine N-methyltransferase SETMAR-like [Ceratina calcarata]|uniref:Histone-lysine N-methyltransferase SETMAR-like n=1 Tax=Ceratina calcarata TaxID=156304 RepID=A0AAJ7J5I5_9HYME|nr:histone-lysine N-methyltransferase SETMAR-like [Ceratina calcarata]